MADEVVVHVVGMGCGHCVLAVTEALSAVAGVTAVQIESTTGRTVVTGKDMDETAVQSAVVRAAYRTDHAGPSVQENAAGKTEPSI